MKCTLGDVPRERSVAGVRLRLEGDRNEFSEEVGGPVMFLSMRSGASSIAEALERLGSPTLPKKNQRLNGESLQLSEKFCRLCFQSLGMPCSLPISKKRHRGVNLLLSALSWIFPTAGGASTLVYDPDQAGNRMDKYGRTEHTTSADRFSFRADLSDIDFGADRTCCQARPHPHSSQRRGLGRTRGPDHSIFCRHFRRTGGCSADRHNRNASFYCQGRRVHR